MMIRFSARELRNQSEFARASSCLEARPPPPPPLLSAVARTQRRAGRRDGQPHAGLAPCTRRSQSGRKTARACLVLLWIFVHLEEKPPLVLLWCYSCVTPAAIRVLFLRYSCVILALFLRYSCVILALFWCYSGVILALFWRYSGVIPLLFWLYSFGYSHDTAPLCCCQGAQWRSHPQPRRGCATGTARWCRAVPCTRR